MSNYKESLTEKEQIDYEFHLGLLKKAVNDNLETTRITIAEGFYTLFALDAKEAGYEVFNVSQGYFDRTVNVYLKKHTNTSVNWQQVRINAAIAAMQGFCANPKFFDYNNGTTIPEAATIYADSLIKELKEQQDNEVRCIDEELSGKISNDGLPVIIDFYEFNSDKVELFLGDRFEIKETDGRFYAVRKQMDNVI